MIILTALLIFFVFVVIDQAKQLNKLEDIKDRAKDLHDFLWNNVRPYDSTSHDDEFLISIDCETTEVANEFSEKLQKLKDALK